MTIHNQTNETLRANHKQNFVFQIKIFSLSLHIHTQSWSHEQQNRNEWNYIWNRDARENICISIYFFLISMWCNFEIDKRLKTARDSTNAFYSFFISYIFCFQCFVICAECLKNFMSVFCVFDLLTIDIVHSIIFTFFWHWLELVIEKKWR